MQGTDVVGSLVVFEDGVARKSDYRHFAIREAAGEGRSDDVASIAEVTRRRFARHLQEPPPDTEQKPRRFAYPPNLYVVDGGAPQVSAAQSVLDEVGVTDVAVIGLAKRLEEVWVPAEPDPVILPRNSEGLYLLQRVRDEAHRFAISYHRSKRSKRMTESALDSVRGLGETRRKALVMHFGSLAKLRQAGVDETTAVPGIGAATAAAVLEALAGPGGDADTDRSAASEAVVKIRASANTDREAGVAMTDLLAGSRRCPGTQRALPSSLDVVLVTGLSREREDPGHRGQGSRGPRLVRRRQPSARTPSLGWSTST